MKSIYLTHCSRDKDPSFKDSKEQVIPELLYTSPGLQQFIRYCKANAFEWAIFSDYYGVVLPHDKISWYSKPPAEVNEEEFAGLLDNFIHRLSAYDQIYFYHRQADAHPLFSRLVELGKQKGMKISELTEETIINGRV